MKGRSTARKARAHLSTCPVSKKVRFRDHDEAVAALHRAARAREFSSGITSRHERRTYACAACRGWHLTSQEALVA